MAPQFLDNQDGHDHHHHHRHHHSPSSSDTSDTDPDSDELHYHSPWPFPWPTPQSQKMDAKKSPQEVIDDFWAKFTAKSPGKATTVLPSNAYATNAAKQFGTSMSTTTQASYEAAAEICKAKVAKIVKECRRVNQKYRDPHFDLELDLKDIKRDTLEALNNKLVCAHHRPGAQSKPKSAKRVADVFDEPNFFGDGPRAKDVRQGKEGDCWLMAAICTLAQKPSLIERCCVALDVEIGVYGFVFHRDGEWISEIIDDKLFLTKADYDDLYVECSLNKDREAWDDVKRVDSEEEYRKTFQRGSGALYFASCVDANKTWLPLLEKAYAKAHGDYSTIDGGFTGEGVEDLTGGVTSELYLSDVLDRDAFWNEELMKVNDQFLFGCCSGLWRGAQWKEQKGIASEHAYSVMRAVEMDGQRLLLIRNPWGKGEWKGAWSDGSKEWTAEWLTRLDHQFGDDGAFWISYADFIRKFHILDRTRLFGPEWKVESLWTTLWVPWTLDYHDTYFAFSVAQKGPVVVVLSQLDERYFLGLEGQYKFTLGFRLHKAGQEGYVVRTISSYFMSRSVNVELDLEAGDYTVLLKIKATRRMFVMPLVQVFRGNVRFRRDKLMAAGMSYDLAHSKGKIIETAEEQEAKRAAEQRKRNKQKSELKEKMMAVKRKAHYDRSKALARQRARRAKDKARRRAKAEVKTETSGGQHAEALNPVLPLRPHVEDNKNVPQVVSAAAKELEPEGQTTQPGLNQTDSHKQDEVKAYNADAGSDSLSDISEISDMSDRELEFLLVDQEQKKMDAPTPPLPTPPSPAPANGKQPQKQQPPAVEELDEFEKDPWNAVVTVGLRIYYKVAEKDKDKQIVSLRVVRPNIHAEQEGQKEGGEKGPGTGAEKEPAKKENDATKDEVEGEKEKGLDVDDSSKDATLVGDSEQRKKSIVATGKANGEASEA